MQKAKAFEQKERLIEEEVGTWNMLELPFYVHLFCHTLARCNLCTYNVDSLICRSSAHEGIVKFEGFKVFTARTLDGSR